MSYETERYNFEKLSSQSLAITQCGLQICHSGHSSGKKIYTDYSVHFILEGQGKYFVNGKVYELKAGQGFIIIPNVPNTYIADENEPWKYIYATFKGPDAESVIHNAGIDEDDIIFSFPLDENMIYNLKSMYMVGKNNYAKGYDSLGYFLLAMSRVIKDYNEKKQMVMTTEHYIKRALLYIEEHFSEDISVKDIARFVGIDRTHMYRLFMKNLKVSPSKYLTDVRLKYAVKLMENEKLSINEIVGLAGFYDLSHFSKVFFATYGMSPGKYRNSKYNI